MKNFYLTLIGASLCTLSFAQVRPIAGAVTPETSTQASPKVYNLMSSHITASDRQNRFLTLENDQLKTTQFTSGIATSSQDPKYWWRLEEGTDGTVILVNQGTQEEVSLPANPFQTNVLLGVSTEGVEWTLATSASTGQGSTAENQYCFRVKNAPGEVVPTDKPYYLNAMDTSFDFQVTLYEMGTHQASGWFFYPVDNELVTSLSAATHESVHIYPNPCADYLKVAGLNTKASLSVYNIAGVEVLNANATTLQTASLPAGTYVLKVTTTTATQLLKFNKK